jgi:lysozyme family protein
MSHFDKAMLPLIEHEGGFQNDPDDSGNWTGGKVGVGELKGTKWGICAARTTSSGRSGAGSAAAEADT